MFCAFLSVVYLISGYWKWMEIGVSMFALIIMICLPVQSSFCIFMFLHSFTLSNIGYDSCFMVTLIGFCLILLVKYIVGVKRGQYQYHAKLVLTIALFYTITTALTLFQQLYRGAWLYFTYIPMAYFLFTMKEDFDIAQGMNYMFGGLLTSCALALVTLGFTGFQYVTVFLGRFRAFINNTNYVYMRAIFILSYYMYRHLNQKLSNIKFIIIFSLCAIITFSTLSKTGIAMLALFFAFYVILSLKQDYKRNYKFVGILLVTVCILCLCSSSFITQTIKRFLEANESQDALNSLLTNRDLIWSLYLKKIFSSPFKFLFGHGLLVEQIYIASIFGPTETHNFYLFLLYRFGLLGTIALGYIVYLFIRISNKEKPKLIAYLPLIFILIESLFDNTFKCYNFTYFIFAVMILFMNCKDKKAEASKNKKLK